MGKQPKMHSRTRVPLCCIRDPLQYDETDNQEACFLRLCAGGLLLFAEQCRKRHAFTTAAGYPFEFSISESFVKDNREKFALLSVN